MMTKASSIPDSAPDFRAQVRGFLLENAHSRDQWQYFRDRSGPTAMLYRELGRRGWLSVSWPPSHGGAGRSAHFEFSLWDEMAYARAARPPIAAGLIARSIIEHASPDQQARWLPDIAAGKSVFALGYSEPEAGSDLTGLRTRARRDGETYVVNGEKRWTSDAHHAHHLWLLCRTGDRDSRSRGLSLFIVPMSSPGITVSPIMTLDGHQLNEVRLDDVEVPSSNRIGQEGQAWGIVQGALARERHLQILPGRLRRDLAELVDWAVSRELIGRRDVANRIAMLSAWIEAVAVTAGHIVEGVARGSDTSLASARQKVVGTALMQEIARLPAECGDASQLVGGESFEFMWRECILESIAGGTSEVMTGIVARRALDLNG